MSTAAHGPGGREREAHDQLAGQRRLLLERALVAGGDGLAAARESRARWPRDRRDRPRRPEGRPSNVRRCRALTTGPLGPASTMRVPPRRPPGTPIFPLPLPGRGGGRATHRCWRPGRRRRSEGPRRASNRRRRWPAGRAAPRRYSGAPRRQQRNEAHAPDLSLNLDARLRPAVARAVPCSRRPGAGEAVSRARARRRPPVGAAAATRAPSGE